MFNMLFCIFIKIDIYDKKKELLSLIFRLICFLSLKLFLELFDKTLNALLITSVICPLARSMGFQETSLLQFDEVARNDRLSESCFF